MSSFSDILRDDAGEEGPLIKGGALDDRRGRGPWGVGEQGFDLGFDLRVKLNLKPVLDPGLLLMFDLEVMEGMMKLAGKPNSWARP